MILVDTNVVSEPTRPIPDVRVLDWLDQRDVADLFLAVTSLTELKFGVAILPEGKRKKAMQDQLAILTAKLFSGRVLTVTSEIADIHATISSDARRKGFTMSFADAQIAAIAMAHGFAVATRDVEPFKAAGVDVINPWEA